MFLIKMSDQRKDEPVDAININKEVPFTDISGNRSSYKWTPSDSPKTTPTNNTCTCLECLNGCMCCMNFCEMIMCCIRCLR